LLVDHLLRTIGFDPTPFLTLEALTELASHRWPGNVRELRNTLERAASLSVPLEIDRDSPSRGAVDLSVPLKMGKQRLIADYERHYLEAMLAACRGNISEVARRSGAERMTIYRIMRRNGLRTADEAAVDS
jgi:DNA-binding NtrC family response regulator